MNCQYCSAEIRENSLYCYNCGRKVEPARGPAAPRQAIAMPAVPFVSGHGRARWVILLLAAGIVMDLIIIASHLLQLAIIWQATEGILISEAEALAYDAWLQATGMVHLVVYVVTSLVFLVWFYRTYKNLSAFGARDLRFSPRSAVLYWFIPLLSLFVPYQVAREIWQASDPDTGASDPAGWKHLTASPLLMWWWLFFIASLLVAQYSSQYARGVNTLDGLLIANGFVQLSDVIHIAAAILTILLVTRIDSRQAKKDRRLSGLNGLAPA